MWECVLHWLACNVSIFQAWFYADTTNYSQTFRKCSKQMTLNELDSHYSGYMISWRELFSKVWNRNMSTSFIFCNVDLSLDVPRILRRIDVNTIKTYVIVNALMTSDVYSILPPDVPRYERNGHDQEESTKMEYLTFKGIEHKCLQHLTKYIPRIYLFKTNRIDSLKAEDTTRKLFHKLKRGFDNVFEDLYWIPEEQRKLLLKPFDDVSLQYNWGKMNNSSLLVFLTDFITTKNFFLNFHSLLSKWNAYRIERGNVIPKSRVFERPIGNVIE